MTRRRGIREPLANVSAQVSLNDYNTVLQSLRGKGIAEFIRESFKAVAEEERKKEQQQQQQQPNPLRNSAIASLMNFNTNSNNDNVKKKEELTPTLIKEYFIHTILDYVKEEDDTDNIRLILPDLRQLYQLAEERVRNRNNNSPRMKKLNELYAATTEGKKFLAQTRTDSNNQ